MQTEGQTDMTKLIVDFFFAILRQRLKMRSTILNFVVTLMM